MYKVQYALKLQQICSTKGKKKITAYLIMITIVIAWGEASAPILWASQLNSIANSQNDAQYPTRVKSMDDLGTEQPV